MINISPQAKIGALIFAFLIFTYVYFQQSFSSHNSISRVALILSIMEHHSFNINNYEKASGDKAYYKGNYYSEKAPGSVFISLPFIYLYKKLLNICDNTQHIWKTWDDITQKDKIGIIRICSFLCSGLATAITAVLIYFISLKIGSSTTGAIFASLSFGIATPAWGWATQFFGHALASVCLFTGFALIIYLNIKKPQIYKDRCLGFLAGSSLSWSIVSDYTSAIAAAILTICSIVLTIKWDKNRTLAIIKYGVIGSVLFMMPLLIYNYLIFGSPIITGYRYQVGFENMQTGLYGINIPNIENMYNIIFSRYRGIIWISPILGIIPYSLFRIFKQKRYRYLAVTISLITIYYILLNSGFYYWWGGWSTGPRYITPILPFLCLSLSILWTQASNHLKIILIVLFIISFIINLICVSVDMTSPEYIKDPIFEYLIPNFIKGHIPKDQSLFVNLTGYKFLIPYLIVLIISSLSILKFNRKAEKDIY